LFVCVCFLGPLPGTIGDFWKMVWEESIQTLVMLTNVQEKGKVGVSGVWLMGVASRMWLHVGEV